MLRRSMRPPSLLTILWVILVVWYEIGVFRYSALRCSWPSNNSGLNYKYKHVLVWADPQILSGRSYPDRSPWLIALSRFIVDLNLRKSWWAARKSNPDLVVVLGDMMDGGRDVISDGDYESYISRFRHIFQFGERVKVYYATGNHDVGLGKDMVFSNYARDRFRSHFGPFNQVVNVTKDYSLVIVDAPGLSDEDDDRIAHGRSLEQEFTYGDAMSFINSVASSPDLQRQKLILFSHIPLYRPANADCGTFRERGTIRAGSGPGYNNLLNAELSRFILDHIRPVFVLSGDDHDYCEYVHESHASDVREVTVKSPSMAMGIKKPGYQLISIPEDGKGSYADKLCLLPDQIGIYTTVYLPCLAATLVVLFVGRKRQAANNGRPEIVMWWEKPRSGRRRAVEYIAMSLSLRLERRRGGGGWIGELMKDLRDVGWVPLSVYLVITISMFI